MEGFVRNISSFARFLGMISFSHGAVLNISNVARECEVSRKTVEGYIDILEDLLLAFRISVFRKQAKRTLSVHPKFYYFDAGVYRSLRPVGPLEGNEQILGAALEGLVTQHLRAWCDYSSNKYQIFYWRTSSGIEVDFIVYGENVFCALEVKSSSRIRVEDFRSLKAFKSDYPECECVLLYGGEERRKWDDVWCIPCETFLKELKPDGPLY